eukprot:TRINITY_DN2386_c0_g2_i1.p1 TRINITY_DN2386_c0_g2~~TRINITY_DN2386_c0_g2_i1.p1  ORF type:complete len:710 (+),score=205.48 TRINITY_DN2386_c0_g2_i1:971-3100(+)
MRLVQREVVQHVEKNKMTPSNLGIVFGPTLMRGENETAQEIIKNTQISSSIFELLIKHHERVTELLPAGKIYRIFKSPPPLTESDWTKILTGAAVEEHQEGELILGQGVQNYNLFRISSGRVRIVIGSNQVATMGPGEIFGELSFLGRFQTSAAVVADGDHTLLHVIDLNVVRVLFRSEHALREKFYYNLAHKLATRLSDREEANKFKSAMVMQKQRQAKEAAKKVEMMAMLDSNQLSMALKNFLGHPRDILVGFWSFARRFHDASEDMREASARALYEQFLSKGQLKEGGVCVPDSLAQDVNFAISNGVCPPGLFDEVMRLVTEHLTANVFDAFKASEYYIKPAEEVRVPVTMPDGSDTRVPIDMSVGTARDIRRCLQESRSMTKHELFFVLPNGSVAPQQVPDDMPASDILKRISDTSTGTTLCFFKPSSKKMMRRKSKMSASIKVFPCKLQRSGQLSVNQHELVFHSKILGREQAVVLAYRNVEEVVEVGPKKLRVLMKDQPKSKDFTFKNQEERDSAHQIISTILDKYGSTDPVGLRDSRVSSIEMGPLQLAGVPSSSTTSPRSLPSLSPRTDPSSPRELCSDDLTDAHWDLILMGGREIHYSPGEVILSEADELQRIYQIVNGSCVVRKKGFWDVLSNMNAGDTFGEMSFLMGGGATASVLADTEVTVFLLEAEYFKRLFNEHPDISGRWFKYLATVLMQRFKY